MCKRVAFLLGFDLVETVHVELSNEGSEVAVLEMFGEYLRRQFADILYHKTLPIFRPAYYIPVLWVLY